MIFFGSYFPSYSLAKQAARDLGILISLIVILQRMVSTVEVHVSEVLGCCDPQGFGSFVVWDLHCHVAMSLLQHLEFLNFSLLFTAALFWALDIHSFH